MTAPDLTALADKLDERLEALEARLRNEADLEESMGFVSESIVSRNRLATVSEARATLTAALREAARMREAEKITLMLASFKDPRTVSCPDEELELFAKIIEDAKAIHGDLHEDEEPGHGA